MALDRSRASSPDSASVSALQVGAHLFARRLSAGPERLDLDRLDEVVERALPWIEAEDLPLELGLVLLESVVLALLAEQPAERRSEQPAERRRHLSLVPRA